MQRAEPRQGGRGPSATSGTRRSGRGTCVAGALYVLRGNTFIRVSVGGITDEKERVEKSRQLAVAALGRLP